MGREWKALRTRLAEVAAWRKNLLMASNVGLVRLKKWASAGGKNPDQPKTGESAWFTCMKGVRACVLHAAQVKVHTRENHADDAEKHLPHPTAYNHLQPIHKICYNHVFVCFSLVDFYKIFAQKDALTKNEYLKI